MRIEFAMTLTLVLILAVLVSFICLTRAIMDQKQDIQKLRGEINIIRMDHCYMRQEFDLMRDIDIDVTIKRSVSFWEGEPY